MDVNWYFVCALVWIVPVRMEHPVKGGFVMRCVGVRICAGLDERGTLD